MRKIWLLIGLGGCVAFSAVARDELVVSNPVIRSDRADALPKARPEDVGMSSKRLRRIATAMHRHIDSGRIQGAITAVSRRGKVVHFETHGLMDVQNQRAMAADAIFRMASSTKPVLGVATLMLVEEGLLRPRDPVSKYIPEFKEMSVAVLNEPQDQDVSPFRVNRRDPPAHRLVPASREITIHDLLTHTSGLASGGLGSAVSNRPPRDSNPTLASEVPKYAKYVLDFQPGSRWSYSPGVGLNVVARIVEIVSGTTFNDFVHNRIFEPLGMRDTHFNVPDHKWSRRVVIQNRTSRLRRPPTTFFSASGGLSSTAEDYLRFEQMLVGGGQLFEHRLLSPRTVRILGSNHVGDLYRSFSRNQNGMGYGYTVAVVTDPIASSSRRSAGAFGWGGAFGTQSWTDPTEELAAVLMLQQPYRPAQYDFGNAVQQAIID